MMARLSRNTFWQLGIFRLTIAVCILFILLMVLAMFLYPGGTLADPHRQGYSFFLNFLSDLGRTVTPSGQPNLASHVLFTIALSLGALSFAPFFVALTQLFTGSGLTMWLSRLGAGCGLISSIGFLGVAYMPLNISAQVHNLFLDAAFASFLLAFVLLFLAALLTPDCPRQCVWVFSAFAALLVVYLLAILFGPAAGPSVWAVIQATGQKIVVFASIITALIQALSAPSLLLKRSRITGKAVRR
jgi:hypothetical protein